MSLRRFVGHVAMITGAANGIGRACAVRFAEEGANVTCLDVNESANQAAAAECRELGVESIALPCDVTDPDRMKAVVEATMTEWGRVDVLVAAAGIYTGAPLWQVSLKQWQRLIDINLTGVFLSNQAVAEIMIKQKSGSIINISSMAGKTSFPASAEYSASKSGVIGLTRSVAMDLAPYGVTANAVCPGNTLTDMVKNVAAEVGGRDGLTAEEWLQMRANDHPGNLPRFGQAIEVDGGMVMS